MPIVPDEIKNRVKKHLGYNRPRAINPATASVFETNLNSVINNGDIYSRSGPSLINYLERCDKLWRMTDPTDPLVFSQFQQIIGDVNRQTRSVTIDDVLKKNREAYYKATDDLANFVNVQNLARVETAAYLFDTVGGSEYVFAPPGAADTCVSDRIYLSINYA